MGFFRFLTGAKTPSRQSCMKAITLWKLVSSLCSRLQTEEPFSDTQQIILYHHAHLKEPFFESRFVGPLGALSEQDQCVPCHGTGPLGCGCCWSWGLSHAPLGTANPTARHVLPHLGQSAAVNACSPERSPRPTGQLLVQGQAGCFSPDVPSPLPVLFSRLPHCKRKRRPYRHPWT